jgi:hypothetical protein
MLLEILNFTLWTQNSAFRNCKSDCGHCQMRNYLSHLWDRRSAGLWSPRVFEQPWLLRPHQNGRRLFGRVVNFTSRIKFVNNISVAKGFLPIAWKHLTVKNLNILLSEEWEKYGAAWRDSPLFFIFKYCFLIIIIISSHYFSYN